MELSLIDQFIHTNKSTIRMYVYSIVEVFQPVLNQRQETFRYKSIEEISRSLYEKIIKEITECLQKNIFDFELHTLGYAIVFRLDDTVEWNITIMPQIRTLTFDFQNIPEEMIKTMENNLAKSWKT